MHRSSQINTLDFDARLTHSLLWGLPLECFSPSVMFVLGLVMADSLLYLYSFLSSLFISPSFEVWQVALEWGILEMTFFSIIMK